jgi:hypothetical protein
VIGERRSENFFLGRRRTSSVAMVVFMCVGGVGCVALSLERKRVIVCVGSLSTYLLKFFHTPKITRRFEPRFGATPPPLLLKKSTLSLFSLSPACLFTGHFDSSMGQKQGDLGTSHTPRSITHHPSSPPPFNISSLPAIGSSLVCLVLLAWPLLHK